MMMFTLLYASLDWVHIFLWYLPSLKQYDDLRSISFRILVVTKDFLYFCSTLMTYFIFILRVTSTFNRTVYKVTKNEWIFFATLMILSLIAIIVFLFFVSRDFTHPNTYVMDITVALVIVFLNDIIFHVCILKLFLSKLRKHVTNTDDRIYQQFPLFVPQSSISNFGSSNVDTMNRNSSITTGLNSTNNTLNNIDSDINININTNRGSSITNNQQNNITKNASNIGDTDGGLTANPDAGDFDYNKNKDGDLDSNANSMSVIDKESKNVSFKDLSAKEQFMLSKRNHGYSLSPHQMQIAYVMTKTTLLTIIAAIFNQAFSITLIINHCSQTYSNCSPNEITHWGIVSYCCRAIEGIVKCLVLFLTFSFHTELYNTWCMTCHKALSDICILRIKYRIHNQRVKYHSMTLPQNQLNAYVELVKY